MANFRRVTCLTIPSSTMDHSHVVQIMKVFGEKIQQQSRSQYDRFRNNNMKEILSQFPKGSLDLSDFDLNHVIGEGAFGTVIKCHHRKKPVAVKVLSHLEANLNDILLELQLLKCLRGNKRIIQLNGAFFQQNFFFVFELQTGNLLEASPISRRNACRFAYQLLEGLEYLKSKRIVHCDLKRENVLVTKENNVQISDFGSAIEVKEGKNFCQSEKHRGTLSISHGMSLKKRLYGYQTDVFSVGLTIFEALTDTFLMQCYSAIDNRNNMAKFYEKCFFDGRIIEVFHKTKQKYLEQKEDGIVQREKLSNRICRKVRDESLKQMILHLTKPDSDIEEIPLAEDVLYSGIISAAFLSCDVTKIDDDNTDNIRFQRESKRKLKEMPLYKPLPNLIDSTIFAFQFFYDPDALKNHEESTTCKPAQMTDECTQTHVETNSTYTQTFRECASLSVQTSIEMVDVAVQIVPTIEETSVNFLAHEDAFTQTSIQCTDTCVQTSKEMIRGFSQTLDKEVDMCVDTSIDLANGNAQASREDFETPVGEVVQAVKAAASNKISNTLQKHTEQEGILNRCKPLAAAIPSHGFTTAPRCTKLGRKHANTIVKRTIRETKSKKFHCVICGVKYIQRSSLYRHNSIVHTNGNNKRFECSVCKLSFTREDNLKRHLPVHQLSRLAYLCTMCDFETDSKKLLKQHNEFMHAKLKDDERC